MTFHIIIVHVKISQVKLLAVKCYHWVFIFFCISKTFIPGSKQLMNKVWSCKLYSTVEWKEAIMAINQSIEFVGSDNSDVTDDLKEATRQKLLVFHSPHHRV